MAPDAWREITVGQIASQQRNALVGGPFGSNLVSSDYVEEGVPIIRGQNMGHRWVGGEFAFVTREKASSLQANLARPGDLIFTQRGTLGQVAIVPKNRFEDYVISQSQMKLTVDAAIADPMFVYYFFTSEEQLNYIRSNAIQTGVPHTNLGILRNTPIRLPAMSTQRAIAHILGTLDDKIELNRRMNETLEAMARAIFKDWFVDFGPTLAKVEGRFANLPPSMAEFFPSEFDDAGVPRGWQTFNLAEIAQQIRESTLPTLQSEKIFEHYSLPAFDDGQNPRLEKGEQILSQKTIVPDGAILLSKLNPEISRVWIPNNQKEVPKLSSTEFLVFTPKGATKRSLLYCLFKDQDFRNILEGMVTGTSKSHQRISPNSLSSMSVLCGSERSFEQFELLAAPLLERTLTTRLESRLLREARDALLPKLISGEIRVKDAERIAEAAQ